MKAKDLGKLLNKMAGEHGEDFEVVLQDSSAGKYPDCCKHGEFFAVEEPVDGEDFTRMELVLRTWPY